VNLKEKKAAVHWKFRSLNLKREHRNNKKGKLKYIGGLLNKGVNSKSGEKKGVFRRSKGQRKENYSKIPLKIEV